jgi:hypothetical protein
MGFLPTPSPGLGRPNLYVSASAPFVTSAVPLGAAMVPDAPVSGNGLRRDPATPDSRKAASHATARACHTPASQCETRFNTLLTRSLHSRNFGRWSIFYHEGRAAGMPPPNFLGLQSGSPPCASDTSLHRRERYGPDYPQGEDGTFDCGACPFPASQRPLQQRRPGLNAGPVVAGVGFEPTTFGL